MQPIIKQALLEGPKRLPDLAVYVHERRAELQLRAAYKHAAEALNKMLEQGIVRQVERGKWALV